MDTIASFTGHYLVGQETGSKFVPPNSLKVQWETEPTQLQEKVQNGQLSDGFLQRYTIPEDQMVWNGADLFHLLNVWRKKTQNIIDDATCWVHLLYNINQIANGGIIVPDMV